MLADAATAEARSALADDDVFRAWRRHAIGVYDRSRIKCEYVNPKQG